MRVLGKVSPRPKRWAVQPLPPDSTPPPFPGGTALGQSIGRGRRKRAKDGGLWITYGLLITIVLVSAFPLYWSVVVSSRDKSSVGRYPPPLVPGGNLWDNLSTAFVQGKFGLALLNSTLVAGSITLSVVLTSTLAGFAFAKLRFRGRNALFTMVVATMLVPTQLAIIPLYIMVTQWFGWSNDLRGVIVPALVSAFGVFFMRQYLTSAMPDELIEAGRVDGASTLRIYWSLVLPIARPGAAVLGLLIFITYWNDLFWPLILLNTQNPTVQVAIANTASGIEVDYSLVLAGTVIATFPILIVFLILGRQIIGGIMQGAVKG
ncbi:cellobiose ABC transporter membrane protein [Actinokineospora alba]|uniref:Cellobiose ABC transporter membrane protein n=1 Tax=Actinokineospora alba TaxID=504798 RepID=A0A1H0ELW0_9PSEU|nr:cellobiose ABC transporter membrane protein [Actinokineospora alba]SDI23664.1 cellobiose transport system permease protein [Actinokineospora alba]SDN83341.1 cellobiose ABC transporter membrane protein [Actinokineospora alba]